MNTLTDQQLLREYAASRSEPAFRELVRRHLDLVHSAALRLVRNSHTAEDVTQAVFTALSKDARRVAAHPVLAGWLHRTTRHLSANTIRADVRRRSREQQAIAMNEQADPDPDPSWTDFAPHLDAVLGELSEADRDAVILRYFEKRSAKEIAVTQGITPEAAQKRVNRAVERLRESFARRGVTAAGTALTVALHSHAVQAAPAGLAATITARALAGSATTEILAMNTLQKLLLPALIVFLAGAWLHQNQEAARLRAELPALRELAAHLPPRDGPREAMAMPVRAGRQRPDRAGAPAAGFSVAAGVSVDGEWQGVDLDPELTSLDNLGRPTTDAVEKLGLTEEEIAALTAAVTRAREEATADFVERVKLTAQGPKEDGSYHYTYHAPARPDRGQHFFNALSKSFAEAIGQERADRLRSGLVEDDFLGGMGKYDLEFDFMRNAQGNMSVKHCYRNPKTGEIERTTESAMDSFEEDFGQVFEFPDEGGTSYPKIPIRSLPESH